MLKKRKTNREFPGSQWLDLDALTAMGPGSIPGQGTEIPQDIEHQEC